MSRALRSLLLASATSALAACGGGHTSTSAAPAPDASIAKDLEKVRNATRPYHDLAAAHAAGYPTMTVPQCLSNGAEGGMGMHYVNKDQMDGKLDLEHPEILMYAPQKDGHLKLIGVEYIIPYRVLPEESPAPQILGQPLKKSAGLKLWYLHVWAWENNKSGLFADYNPAVSCPAEKAGM